MCSERVGDWTQDGLDLCGKCNLPFTISDRLTVCMLHGDIHVDLWLTQTILLQKVSSQEISAFHLPEQHHLHNSVHEYKPAHVGNEQSI